MQLATGPPEPLPNLGGLRRHLSPLPPFSSSPFALWGLGEAASDFGLHMLRDAWEALFAKVAAAAAAIDGRARPAPRAAPAVDGGCRGPYPMFFTVFHWPALNHRRRS